MSKAEFDECFADLYRVAYRVSYRLLGGHEPAQDIAQEAMTRAYVCWRRLDHDRNPRGWVAQVSANLAIKAWRRNPPMAPLPADGYAASAESLAELRAELVSLLRRLPAKQREVVVLRYLADLSERDVALRLGCSPGAVKQHASRGLARLRVELANLPVEVTADVQHS